MTAFRATYSDFKLIKTRQSVQIVFEIPVEHVDAALEVLGGMPNPSSERWFGIAPLTERAAVKPQPVSDKPPAGAKRPWHEQKPQTQAAIRVSDPVFSAFLKEEHPDEWHETGDADACIKFMFKIRSKTELETNHVARMAWHQLNEHFVAWKAVEHA